MLRVNSVCISYFSGGFRPPPATLAMVVGGGGRILDHMSPLDMDFAIRRRHIGLVHANRD